MSIPVVVTNFNGIPQPPGFVLFETFVDVHSTSGASLSGGTITQDYSGTIEFTSTPRRRGSQFSHRNVYQRGLLGKRKFGFSECDSTELDFHLQSGHVWAEIQVWRSRFPAVTPPLGISGGSVASFAAQNAGTFSATAVPEPSALCLASFAAVIGTLAAYGKKRMKNEPAN